MGLGRFGYMIGSSNNYSILRWPSILNSLLLTILFLILLVSFNSNRWFRYDAINFMDLVTLTNGTIHFSEKIEKGSLGLWYSCIDRVKLHQTTCEPWSDKNCPHYFTLITIIFTCALYLNSFIIFPTWTSFILIIYNINNRYRKYIIALFWVLCLLTLILTCFLLSVLIVVRSTKFHTPGEFSIGTQYITFYSGRGMIYLIAGTIICIICFVLSIITIGGKIFIDKEVAEHEQELIKQLSDDNNPTVWQKPTMIPRTSISLNGYSESEEPPPYEHSRP